MRIVATSRRRGQGGMWRRRNWSGPAVGGGGGGRGVACRRERWRGYVALIAIKVVRLLRREAQWSVAADSVASVCHFGSTKQRGSSRALERAAACAA